MRLEDVSAELRPRGSWEAIDLGFALVRRHFRLLLVAWAITVLPLWGALLALSPWLPLWLIVLVIWWLKPIYDRVPLFVLSRALFGAAPRAREVLRAWPGLLTRRFLYLVMARLPWLIALPQFSWARSLLLPIIDLEQQRGRAFADRQKVLMRQSGGTAAGLILFCGLYESFLAFALIVMVAQTFTDPISLSESGQSWLDQIFGRAPLSTQLQWCLVAAYLVALTLMELFYVGGGFGLYLNSRTHLEGWDVEIVFRRLARRLAKVSAALLVGAGCLFAWPAVAAPSPQTARDAETVQRVMRDKDFEVHMGERWLDEEKPREEKSSDENSSDNKSKSNQTNAEDRSSQEGAGAAGVVGWIILAVAAGFLIFVIVFAWRGRSPVQKGVRRAGPRTVMGMDITPESLPEDLISSARRLWMQGDPRGALSLLYRGSLSWLVQVARLSIRESDTEGDCLRHSRTVPEAKPRDYFAALTREWIAVAYAHRTPAAGQMESLLTDWPFAEAPGGRRLS